MSRKLSLILRGHIRNSFSDKKLYNYIKDLSNEYDLTIYIQTWNILQTNVSWRYLEKNETPVNEAFIYNYFEDLSENIKKIIILDDTDIVLTGITTGRMGKTSGSYLGWKQMWYGIYEIAEYVKNQNAALDTFIINTRFDVFNNSVSFSENTICDKLNIVMNSKTLPETINKNIFLKNVEFFGIDNFYIGNAKTIFDLAERFKFHLDEIVLKYPRVKSHEFYTFHVNNTLFLKNWLNTSGLTKEEPINKLISGPNSDVNILVNLNGGTRSTDSMNIDLFKPTKNSNDTTIISEEEISKSVSDRNVTLLPVSRSRNNQIQLFESNPRLDISINPDSTEMQSLIQSVQARGSKMALFESNVDVNKSLTVKEIPHLSLLQSSNESRSSKMALLESNDNLPTTVVNIKEGQNLLVLPPVVQTKGSKLSLLDSNLPNTVDSNIDTTTDKPALSYSNVYRKGSISLVDSTVTSVNTINSVEIDLPISSTNVTRSSRPLVNTTVLEDKSSDFVYNSSVTLTNNNTRKSRPQMNITKKSETVIDSPSISKTQDEKIKPSTVESLPQNIVHVETVAKKVPIIKKPIPISKFSVTLDPTYLYSNNDVSPNYITNIPNANVKLIHSDKFKTNTQSLSAYYALLSR
jgi:hypothetical protein